MLQPFGGGNVARDPDPLEDARRQEIVVKLLRIPHDLIDIKKQLAFRNIGKIGSNYRRQQSRTGVRYCQCLRIGDLLGGVPHDLIDERRFILHLRDG